jgi:polysaccharide export outer membrane protein
MSNVSAKTAILAILSIILRGVQMDQSNSSQPSMPLPKQWSKTLRTLTIPIPLLLGLSACSPGGDLKTLPPVADQDYHLGAGDQIRVITYDEPQLTNTFTVGADGSVAIPLVGTVQASGLTTNQLAAAITSSLANSKMISQPSISVEVAAYRPISVLGEVNHPGQYPYEPGMTTLDAVALAGGFTYRAVTAYAEDLRSDGYGEGQALQGRIEPGSNLEPGDVITVYERYF